MINAFIYFVISNRMDCYALIWENCFVRLCGKVFSNSDKKKSQEIILILCRNKLKEKRKKKAPERNRRK